MTVIKPFEHRRNHIVSELPRLGSVGRSQSAQREEIVSSAVAGQSEKDMVIEGLRAQIEDLKERHVTDLEEARTQGVQDGAEEAAANTAQLIGAISGEIEKATNILTESQNSIEALSVQFARQVLRNVFLPDSAQEVAVVDGLRKLLNDLGTSMVLSIRVSPVDFDPKASEELLETLLGPQTNMKIEIDTSLQKGQCSAQLRLGEVDLSVPDYWLEVEALIEQISEGS